MNGHEHGDRRTAHLYGLKHSHPVLAARMACELVGLEFQVHDLFPGFHPVIVRVKGFHGWTVPALTIDRRMLQGTLVITRALDRMTADTGLFPDDPDRRRAVEEAERFGHDELQEIARRVFRWAGAHDNAIRAWMARYVAGMRAPKLAGYFFKPGMVLFARLVSKASDRQVRDDLARLPALLDRADMLIEDGTIGGTTPNAADLQILTSIRALLAHEDLRPLIEARASSRAALRLIPDYPRAVAAALPPVPAALPTGWLPSAPTSPTPAPATREVQPKSHEEEVVSTVERPLEVDTDKLMQFVFRAVDEVGATLNSALVVMGDKLGLYRAMAGAHGLTPAELADRTGTAERYVREWLGAQAAGGFVEYDPESGRYTLPPEQAVALTDSDSPAYLPGFFQIALGSVIDSPRIIEKARSGEGFGWHEHVHDVHEGCERFFRPGYHAHLVAEWLPALNGVSAKLERGARVADVGCGHGASTILMARAFPNSQFVGTDYHNGSIETARQRAHEAGLSDRVSFEVAPATAYEGTDYDLVTMFDCLHDMGDPVRAAHHVRSTLKPDGTWMIVEPYAGDRLEENLNPVGRAYYAFSTLLCTPASLSQEVGLALGAQAGETRIRDVVQAGGFSRFRRAAETPFNLVFEARL